MRKILIPFLIIAIVFTSCKNDKEDDVPSSPKENLALYKVVDQTIYDIMSVYYLWNNNLPRYRRSEKRNPESYFESLLYTDDKWSFIFDDYEELDAELEGTPYSMGYSPQFHYYNGTSNVMILVEYVYPNSPAEAAGLKRGDIILEVNGKEMTPDNYYDLYSEESATYTLGIYNAATNQFDDGEKISITATEVEADPTVYDTIIDVAGKKVGYLVYTQYINSEKYISHIDEIFDKYIVSGVKDLILDLRYNGGGDVTAAQHLASNIVPTTVVEGKKVFTSFVYNDILTDAYKGDDENFSVKFENTGHNANMENLYVLGTQGTASASELTTIGLMPYMNVTLIGENTYGKCTGMFVFDKREQGCSGLNNWAIAPITMKYANADGYTDFVDGLTPDYKVKDDLLSAYQFGDLNDPMLATAVSLISGDANPLSAKAAHIKPFQYIGRDKSVLNNNLYKRVIINE